MRRMIYVLLLGGIVVGCGSNTTKYDVGKEITVPAEWSSGQNIQSGVVDSLWWFVFDDKGLDNVLSEAFSRNYDLRIAANNVNAASAQAQIAGAPRLPNADLRFNSQRAKQNFIGLPIPGREGAVLSNTNNSFGVSLNLSWELDLWGKLNADEAAAIANVQASEANLKGAKLSLGAQVSKAWFAAIEAKRQYELSQSTLRSFQLSSEQVKNRYESGIRSSLDYRLSLTSVANTEAVLKLRQSQYERTVRQLEILLGRYPSATLELSEGLPDISEDVPVGLPADLITRRPDLVAAELGLIAADANVRSARRSLLPQISLTGGTGTASSELSDLVNGDFSVWNVAGNLLQPVFNRGRLRANVDLQKSNADALYAGYVQSVLRAFAEVETALANEQLLSDREKAIAIAVEQSVAARELAELQYASGLINFVTMLEAQRSAFNNESQLLTAQRERLDSRIDLYLAIGGGFTSADGEENENTLTGKKENE